MRELGISIYPFHSKMEENKSYIDLASKYGFTRCFMCLLSVEHSKEEIIKEFSEIINYAKERGIKTTLDISPAVFKSLEISYDNLEFFYKLGAWAIRLDLGFSGNEESLMTYNDYNLKIELNMSNSTSYIDTIMNYYPNKENLIGCYNFYPHAYSGLDKKLFIESMNRFKKHSIKSSAFINAKEANFGPWPVDDGICTLEEHRNLPIEIQAMELFFLGVDAVFIANCYANEESFKKLQSLDKRLITLKAKLLDSIPEIERKIVLEELHQNRADASEYFIRSSNPRVKYKGHNFKLFNAVTEIKRGDILIDSSEYGSYAGELQIALKDIKNTGRTNVVGRIDEEYLFLLDYINMAQRFKITE
ncbi:DUF871 domain-containing protein [Brachyspira pilosicoli]|uniref:DUF871 domain-containing protein n=1 Tax=Brachyspira pilosicoli TaxID=52584 RepID=UPI001C726B22|nr:MupG family TIM beta-alpha barrel fold protein [Brachyspira pilosicoli]MBW5399832.1 DUF871 domain-containing protein [Brachyspira pilosicoli]